PSAAFLNASFTCSAVTSFSTSTTKSTKETFGVGTRNAIPCNLPFKCGNTSPNAFAAPVDVGTIDWPQARARRKSLCELSKLTLSLVYACTVVINPFTIPHSSSITLATGAKQFVVQDA